MPDRTLEGQRVLVVEDEYYLADDLRLALNDAGADVVGPVGSVEEATELARSSKIDAAVLDVNLRGDMVFPVADLLRERSIPFLFTTGYNDWVLPPRFAQVRLLEKPFQARRVAAMIPPILADHHGRLLH